MSRKIIFQSKYKQRGLKSLLPKFERIICQLTQTLKSIKVLRDMLGVIKYMLEDGNLDLYKKEQ